MPLALLRPLHLRLHQKLLPDARRLPKYSRVNTLRVLDGRSKQARRIKTIMADLVADMGGAEQVSVAQRLLIERLAVDIVRLELLDAKATGGSFTELDGRIAHALRNSVRPVLRDLGLKQRPTPGPSLDDFIASLPQPEEAAE
jgi:hypothetical protein